MAEVPIRVLIRFRPLSAVEKADEKGQRCRFVFDPSSTVVSVSSSSSSSSSTAQSIFSYANVHIDDDFFHSDLPASVADSKAFPFDHIFDPSCSQEDVWEQVQSLCGETLKGFNACFLAYGQTGSGKTHTMMGDLLNPEENGIIPRSLTSILTSEELAKATTEKGAEVQIRCSYLQIYNEQVYDLLDSSKVSLKIRESAQRGGTYVEGLTEEYIASLDDALLLLSIGSANRATASTKMNLNSSRSHTLFAITITQRFPNGSVLQGKLNLVDLAGSEKVLKSGAQGQTLEEAKKINLSLTCLGKVIYALSEPGARKHIPYRDSKLTRILQNSLGGNSKTVLLCCASPSESHLDEALSTLRFGQRAKSIKNKVIVNQTRSAAELQVMIHTLQSETKHLRSKLNRWEKLISDIGTVCEKSTAEDQSASKIKGIISDFRDKYPKIEEELKAGSSSSIVGKEEETPAVDGLQVRPQVGGPLSNEEFAALREDLIEAEQNLESGERIIEELRTKLFECAEMIEVMIDLMVRDYMQSQQEHEEQNASWIGKLYDLQARLESSMGTIVDLEMQIEDLKRKHQEEKEEEKENTVANAQEDVSSGALKRSDSATASASASGSAADFIRNRYVDRLERGVEKLRTDLVTQQGETRQWRSEAERNRLRLESMESSMRFLEQTIKAQNERWTTAERKQREDSVQMTIYREQVEILKRENQELKKTVSERDAVLQGAGQLFAIRSGLKFSKPLQISSNNSKASGPSSILASYKQTHGNSISSSAINPEFEPNPSTPSSSSRTPSPSSRSLPILNLAVPKSPKLAAEEAILNSPHGATSNLLLEALKKQSHIQAQEVQEHEQHEADQTPSSGQSDGTEDVLMPRHSDASPTRHDDDGSNPFDEVLQGLEASGKNLYGRRARAIRPLHHRISSMHHHNAVDSIGGNFSCAAVSSVDCMVLPSLFPTAIDKQEDAIIPGSDNEILQEPMNEQSNSVPTPWGQHILRKTGSGVQKK